MDCCTLYFEDDPSNKSSKKPRLVLIDWKTSQKQKLSVSSTFDNPLQIAAYIGAFNHDPRYPLQIEEGLIVVVYNNGRPANVLPLKQKSLETYWKLWLQRLTLYEKSRNCGERI